MKLYVTPTSAYAWVVRVILAETGLSEQVEIRIVPTRVPDSPINTINPTGKVPTLDTGDGHHLSEARLICQYLDGLHPGPPTVDPDPDVAQRAFEGLAVGFADGLAVWMREIRRPDDEQSPGILAQERARARRCLDHLESETHWRRNTADFVRVSLAVNLLYLDERLHCAWQQDRPGLADWHARFIQRSSMRDVPRGG